MLVTPADKHLFFMMCWWSRQYLRSNLFEGAELLLISAAELQSMFPITQSGWFRTYSYHPIENLVRLYTDWGKPELAEKWRAKLSPEER